MRVSALAVSAATILLAVALGGCTTASNESAKPTPSLPTHSESASATATAEAPARPVTCEYPDSARPAAREGISKPADTPVATGEVSAQIKTSQGTINLTLDADKAPCTVNNFISLAQQGYFDNTVCHRLTVKGIYVLQCGDPSATGSGGPGYSFADELDPNEKYAAGTLAMANAGENTNGSQFFLVYESAPGALQPLYTPFGTFDEDGIKLVQKVAADGLAADGVAPKTEVKIAGVTIEDATASN